MCSTDTLMAFLLFLSFSLIISLSSGAGADTITANQSISGDQTITSKDDHFTLGFFKADFGLAKLVGRDFSRVLTTMRGTRGYLAPEWLSGVAITTKADVYSYGMMMFEFISGARNSEHGENGKKKFFPMEVANVLIDGGDILTLLDPRLDGEASVEELTKLSKVACWCIQDDEENRPSMSQVEQILDGVLDVNMPPKPRALQLFVENNDDVVFFTESSTSQSSQAHSNPSSHVSQAKSAASL
ncbi:putative protein kinase RLK-Pelle-SD-2b family [Helianthus annuus]|nr:putative protein kinase RLK-Pelle-SD-2b family [Helianthus annuus]